MRSAIHKLNKTEDTVLYLATYSPIRILITWLINALGVYLIVGTTVETIKAGEYVLGILWVVLLVAIIAIILDSFLTKGLYFYNDRIEKRWLFGLSRSIVYANAKIIGPPDGYKWLTSGYTIRETNNSGKSILWKLPIQYISFFFKAQDQNKLTKIWEHLTQNKTDNPRIVKVQFIYAETIHSL